MDYFVTALRQNPELAVFLTLALGFLIGRIRIGTFSLGNVVGTLIMGLVFGWLRSVRPTFGRIPEPALLFGRHVLKMNPVLGYTVPYAIGNILLTAWGPVIVVLTK